MVTDQLKKKSNYECINKNCENKIDMIKILKIKNQNIYFTDTKI